VEEEPVSTSLRSRLRRLRRGAFELLGSDRYSRPGLHGLDRLLETFVDFDKGYFVEAGANDGYQQSNTYYLERLRGWRGVLVEPVAELAEECRRNRSRSHVFCCALVSGDFTSPTIEIDAAGLTSSVVGSFGSDERRLEKLRAGLVAQGLRESKRSTTPARTLTSILVEACAPANFDLLSLDVEGFEPEVLRGLDLSRFAPRFICVEVRDEDAINRLLFPQYRRTAVLRDEGDYSDVLFERRIPV
jgi:FkbM family methyltransferase